MSIDRKGYRTSLAWLLVLSLLSMLMVQAAPARAVAPACLLTPIASGNWPGPELSGSGQFIVYANGVEVSPGGNSRQFFRYEVQNHSTEEVSLSYQGEWKYNDDSYGADPSLTDDGNLVVFTSDASEMVPGLSGMVPYHIYLRDMVHNTTELISQDSTGQPGDRSSWSSAITPDGRYVVFSSEARNLVADDTNDRFDVFLRDRQAATTVRVSVASDGSQGLSEEEFGERPVDISDDGRYVVFHSDNLKDDDGTLRSGIFLRDLQEGRTFWIASGGRARISGNGRYIVFNSTSTLVPEDQTPGNDVYLYDRESESFELISIAEDGAAGGFSGDPEVSADGSVVVFTSAAALLPDDSNNTYDIYLRNRSSGVTERLSVSPNGQEANDRSSYPAISADGQRVVFSSRATNLGSRGGQQQSIYLCERIPGGLSLGKTMHLPMVHQ